MNWKQLGRNLLFSAVLLVVVVSISEADLPATHRFEEYLAYVLTTEFDYQGWFAEAGENSVFRRIASWGGAFPWGSDGAVPASGGSAR